MPKWGGEFTWVPGGTCCQLWAKEIERTGKCPACTAPRKEYKGTAQSTDAPFEMAPWEPNGEPVVFCPAPGCGLTVGPGRARCWVHEGVSSGDLRDGRRHPTGTAPSRVRPYRPRAIRKAKADG